MAVQVVAVARRRCCLRSLVGDVLLQHDGGTSDANHSRHGQLQRTAKLSSAASGGCLQRVCQVSLCVGWVG